MAKLEFRETALNQYAALEQIDGMMQVMRPSAWWWLLACGLIALTATFWSLTATIVTRVDGKGILLHRSGDITQVRAPESGRVTHILAELGKRVTAQQVLAEIDQPALRNEVKALEAELAFLKLRRAKSNATSVELERAIMLAQKDLDAARIKYESASKVVAGRDGIISTYLISEGMLVEQFHPLFVMQTGLDDLQAEIFFPADVGKELQPGQLVEISPQSSNKEESGCLLGRIASVSPLPLSPEGMCLSVSDSTLVQRWCSELGAPISARVNLTPDPSSANKYKWTWRRGGNEELSSGTLVNAVAHVNETGVLGILIPALQKNVGERRSD